MIIVLVFSLSDCRMHLSIAICKDTLQASVLAQEEAVTSFTQNEAPTSQHTLVYFIGKSLESRE